MFYKVKKVVALENYILELEFENGTKKYYDVKPLFKKWEVFQDLQTNNLFQYVNVDSSGYGISWNEEIDLSCNELWDNGTLELPI